MYLPDPFENERTLFDRLEMVISSQRFLKMQGLGNEVPFFIAPFPPAWTNSVETILHQLTQKLTAQGLAVQEINLYDLAVALLTQRGIWEQVLAIESQTDKGQLLELLQNVLDPEQHLIPAIGQRIADPSPQVLFLTGVGAVYPYIRSHNVLNNLQSTAKDFPTVLFFPGRYTQSLASGASLDLFGRLHDDKYYRAFNLFDYQP